MFEVPLRGLKETVSFVEFAQANNFQTTQLSFQSGLSLFNALNSVAQANYRVLSIYKLHKHLLT